MLDKVPTNEEISKLVGDDKFQIWLSLCDMIDSIYEMDRIWDSGGKVWSYEYKYRRGGKTLCALYAREHCIGLMIIFGKAEREKFEADIDSFSVNIQQIYTDTKTYHDGKWMMFEPENMDNIEDLKKLLSIKRKPNRK